MHPAKWTFRRHEDEPPTSYVDIHKTLAEDLYLVMNAYDAKSQSVSIKAVVNPLVDLDLARLSLADLRHRDRVPARSRLRARRRGGEGGQDQGAAATVALAVHAAGVGARARADRWSAPPAICTMPRTDRERVLMGKLKCMCGCPHGLQRVRRRVRLRAGSAASRCSSCSTPGKTDQQILQFELNKYGEEVMRIPLDTGYRRMVWVIPVAALFGAAGVLVTIAHAHQDARSQRAQDARRARRRRRRRRVSIPPRR